MSLIYDLPFGEKRYFDLGSAGDLLLGGWSIQMLNTMTPGLALNIGYPANDSGADQLIRF